VRGGGRMFDKSVLNDREFQLNSSLNQVV